MAKSVYGPGIPADQPATQGPGDLTRREKDFFAQESPERGFYVGFTDSAGSFGEGEAGRSRGGRRLSMNTVPPPPKPSFKIKGR